MTDDGCMQKMRLSRSAVLLSAVLLTVLGLSASTLAVAPGSGRSVGASPDPGGSTAAPAAASPTPTPSSAGQNLGPDEAVLGPAAVEAIGGDIDAVAAANELTADELVDALQDPTYGVGPDVRLFVAEFLDGAPTPEASAGPVAEAAVAPLAQTFQLNSLPGSRRTIYLDFDGHTLTDTVWNKDQGIPNGRTVPPFDRDGSPAFSDAELEYVQNVWLAVSEDYAPFDVNVTTQDPGAAALTRSTNTDQIYGARAIITTPNVPSDFPSSCPITSTCAGLAYVNVFDASGIGQHQYYEGAFVNADGVGSPLALTTIISHEVGHNGGLNHAGYNAQDYYDGTGNWGPIMGTPYARALSQWTQHAYTGANNTKGPDLPILSGNGIRARDDETGATVAAAQPLGWTSRSASIASSGDSDMWSLGRCTGSVTITATPSAYSTNLDVSLSLYTDDGTAGVSLATDDPASGQSGSGSSLRATGVSGSITVTGDGAPYYALVRGSTSGPDGGYGNLGPYTLSAVCDGVSQQPPGLARFTDVAAGHVFAEQIDWLAGRGISTGYDNGDGTKRFEPSAAVLREQMAAFLARYEGASLPSVTSAPFTDVMTSHVFAPHIAWLAGTGITTGYDNGNGTFSFRPSAPVLREQMAAFLYRLAGATDTVTSCGLADVPSTHTFAKEICWLKGTEITTGYAVPGGTEFRGSQPVLREQMAAFLFRYDAAGL